MSRYKDHRGPKRRGYDEDYTPDHAAERQPEYFSPRPILTQGSEAVEATVKWFNADKGFGFVVVAGGPDAFLPARALEMAGHSTVPDGARLKVRISQGQKGPQVAEVLEVDTSTAQVMSKALLRLVPPRHGQERERQRNVSVRLNGTTSKKGSVS
jgi:cold shock protein